MQPLEQQLSTLQLSSEQFSARIDLKGAPRRGPLSKLRGQAIQLSGVASASSQQADVTASVAGKSLEVRLLGKQVYVNTPAIAKIDGGRPWVSETLASDDTKLLGSNVSGLGSGDSSGPTFKDLAELISSGSHLRGLGAATIDGQATTGFAETIKPLSIYDAQIPAKVRSALKRLHLKPTAKLQVYLASNGVPVRTQVTLALGAARLHVDSDVTAVNVPVTVAPPAPAETITSAQLKQLIAKRLAEIKHHK
ncbi:MAG TPA: hypothetical protein VH025_00820 [Solirubrobacteraceae bacterium]|nr:hypothetical protein [Solirubrobacteraceae bacterium]